MFLNTLSVILTVFVLNLHHRSATRPVPRWLNRLVFGCLARLLCVYSDSRHRRHVTRSQPMAADYGGDVRGAERHHSERDVNHLMFNCKSRLFQHRHGVGVSKVSTEHGLSLMASQMRDRSKTIMTSQGRQSVHPSSAIDLDGLDLDGHVGSSEGNQREYSAVYNSLSKQYACSDNGGGPGFDLCANCRQELMTCDIECSEPTAVWKEVAQVIDRLFFWLTFTSMALVDAWIFYQLQQ